VTGDPKSRAGKRTVYLPDFLLPELRRHLQWFAEKEPDGLLFVGEKGASFRRSTFGRKWRKARRKVGMPDTFRFYDLRRGRSRGAGVLGRAADKPSPGEVLQCAEDLVHGAGVAREVEPGASTKAMTSAVFRPRPVWNSQYNKASQAWTKRATESVCSVLNRRAASEPSSVRKTWVSLPERSWEIWTSPCRSNCSAMVLASAAGSPSESTYGETSAATPG
jgi:hypothetical protein